MKVTHHDIRWAIHGNLDTWGFDPEEGWMCQCQDSKLILRGDVTDVDQSNYSVHICSGGHCLIVSFGTEMYPSSLVTECERRLKALQEIVRIAESPDIDGV